MFGNHLFHLLLRILPQMYGSWSLFVKWNRIQRNHTVHLRPVLLSCLTRRDQRQRNLLGFTFHFSFQQNRKHVGCLIYSLLICVVQSFVIMLVLFSYLQAFFKNYTVLPKISSALLQMNSFLLFPTVIVIRKHNVN